MPHGGPHTHGGSHTHGGPHTHMPSPFCIETLPLTPVKRAISSCFCLLTPLILGLPVKQEPAPGDDQVQDSLEEVVALGDGHGQDQGRPAHHGRRADNLGEHHINRTPCSGWVNGGHQRPGVDPAQ